MKKVITGVTIVLEWCLFLTSHLSPRSKNIWVFIGWHAHNKREIFADNSKYLFLYLSHSMPAINAVWIAQDRKLAKILTKRGYKSYYYRSLKGMYYALRAGHTIVDAHPQRHNWAFFGRTTITQLWHGKGMKKSGLEGIGGFATRSKFLELHKYVQYNHIIASSPSTAKLMASTFGVTENDIAVTGLPRDDVLYKKIQGSEIDSHTEMEACIKYASMHGAEKILMYAPTFRRGKSNPIDSLDLVSFEAFLKTNNYHLIVLPHPKFASSIQSDTSNYKHISIVRAGLDIYPQLPLIDMMITDYSNIYIDFLLLDRPVYFYTYDLADYKENNGLHDEFESFTPGAHVATLSELFDALLAPDTHQNKRKQVRKELFTFGDSEASSRVVDLIQKNK